jgi:hypothetical protein
MIRIPCALPLGVRQERGTSRIASTEAVTRQIAAAVAWAVGA